MPKIKLSEPDFHFGIDGNEANVSHRVGSNQYAYQLLRSLYLTHPKTRFTIYLKDTPLADMPSETQFWRYRVLKPRRFWTQLRLPLSLYSPFDRPNVFYSPGHYAPRRAPIPTVITILDLAFLKYPNLFNPVERGYLQLKQWTQYSVSQSSRIITISESSKQEIIAAYQYPKDRIHVAYPGINTADFTPQSKEAIDSVIARYHLNRPFCLYVGTIQPRKNLVRLIQAFETLPHRYHHVQLVIAGGSGWQTQPIFQTINQSKAKDRIKVLGFVPQPDLPALYSAARCAILIGLHEGFGIPPAEALACGTLPVVSQTAALPEVVGNGGIYVDPFSLTSIKHGIITAVDLPEDKRVMRIELGKRHIQQFTWEKTASTVFKTLYDLALQRP